MAAQTILLKDARVALPDLDRLRKVLKRKGTTVVPAIDRLGPQLWNDRVRQMALHARCIAMVACVLP